MSLKCVKCRFSEVLNVSLPFGIFEHPPNGIAGINKRTNKQIDRCETHFKVVAGSKDKTSASLIRICMGR